ncbi:MAG: arylsulfatase [Bacteroidaceae bacterium]|nr:arylsulfatase [Bacteroidaceae bacterium]
MTRARELVMAAFGLLPVAVNAHAPSPVADGNDTARRPNIIFIMCDDMGYADLGCYGQRRIETPNLDRMAQEGMRFTQAYAASPVSAPSRASFMTGQHAGHTHVRGNREYWNKSGVLKANAFGSNSDYSIIGQEPYLMTHQIIPEVMKEAGYTTGMFGKWAGGYYNMQYPDTYAVDANGNSDTSKFKQSSSASLPNKRGVDCYYGYICQFQAHTYYPNFLNRYDPVKYGDRHVVLDTLKQNIRHKDVASGNKDYENREQYTSDLIHQYALDWIDRQTGEQPFMGIFTYTLPHAELWQPNDSLVQRYTEKFQGEDGAYSGNFGSWYYRNYGRRAQFAAMVSRLDAQVGEIFDKLKEKGFDENTLVIFTSDNGPHEEGGADPAWFNHDGLLRGTKRSTHEGGIRVPFIAKGPGVPAGTVNDHQLAFYDVMPTLLDYAGLDGDRYSKKASTEERCYDGISFHETLTGNDAAQEKHDFLYWEFHETNMMAVRMGDWKLVVKGGTPYLYDLSKDLHEDSDVAAQNPGIVRQMIEIIHEQHTESSMFGVTLPEIPDESVVVTEVKTDRLYTIECQPNDGHTTRFISDNDGTVNGQTAKGTKFRFEEAIGGGYYIKSTVSGKYINANVGQTDISFDAEAKSAWTLGQLSKSDAYVYFTVGGNKYLNNHQGGADNLRLATHNPIGQNNKCSLWTLHQYEEGETGINSANAAMRMKDGKFIEDEQLVIIRNGVKYNIKGQRTM